MQQPTDTRLDKAHSKVVRLLSQPRNGFGLLDLVNSSATFDGHPTQNPAAFHQGYPIMQVDGRADVVGHDQKPFA